MFHKSEKFTVKKKTTQQSPHTCQNFNERFIIQTSSLRSSILFRMFTVYSCSEELDVDAAEVELLELELELESKSSRLFFSFAVAKISFDGFFCFTIIAGLLMKLFGRRIFGLESAVGWKNPRVIMKMLAQVASGVESFRTMFAVELVRCVHRPCAG